jgi:hypothetical protein
MNKLALTFLLVLVFVAAVTAQTYMPITDSGNIVEIEGDRIYFNGTLGPYVFDMISPCSWCERRAEATVNFESWTRATMTPLPNLLQVEPIQMFIVKDARLENQ